MADGRRVTVRDCAFVVPPPPDNAVVRDYAGGLGFEAASDYVLPPLDLLQLAAVAHPTFLASRRDRMASTHPRRRESHRCLDRSAGR